MGTVFVFLYLLAQSGFSRTGVINRWIFGALDRDLECFSLAASSRRMTKFRTSSSFSRLNNFRILLARFGPKRRSTTASVKPAISLSPFRTMQVDKTAKSWLTMQPRTDFRFRSPDRLQV